MNIIIERPIGDGSLPSLPILDPFGEFLSIGMETVGELFFISPRIDL